MSREHGEMHLTSPWRPSDSDFRRKDMCSVCFWRIYGAAERETNAIIAEREAAGKKPGQEHTPRKKRFGIL